MTVVGDEEEEGTLMGVASGNVSPQSGGVDMAQCLGRLQGGSTLEDGTQ